MSTFNTIGYVEGSAMAGTPSATARLEADDPLVRRAREAERTAYERYDLDPTEHTVEVDALDSRIRVVEVGEGPPLVLINGGEGKGMMWLPLLPELDDFTCYVMDRPGGGLSDGIDYRSVTLRRAAASSTRSLFDHFDLDTAPVVGNSMGGLWTIRFALEHPDRIAAVGLLGCPALYPRTSAPLPMRVGSISALTGFVVRTFMQAGGVSDVRDAWSFLGHPGETRERLPEEFAEAWYRMEQLPNYVPTWTGILQTALRLRGANPDVAFTDEDLRAVRAPVTLLWGRDDPFGSVETGRTGAEHFADASFHEVGVGHLPWLDDPETCGSILRPFLSEHT